MSDGKNSVGFGLSLGLVQNLVRVGQDCQLERKWHGLSLWNGPVGFVSWVDVTKTGPDCHLGGMGQVRFSSSMRSGRGRNGFVACAVESDCHLVQDTIKI